MMRRSWWGCAVLAVLASAGLACGGGEGAAGPPVPDPGPVTLILTTPNANDGMLLVSVTGGPVSGVAAQGYELAITTPGVSGVTLLVRGSVVDGAIAQLVVPDRKKLARYRVTVQQAAARLTYGQQTLVGYSIALRAP
jgi:hypothetical protein